MFRMITEGSIRLQVKELLLKKKGINHKDTKIDCKTEIPENNGTDYNEVCSVFNYPLPVNKAIPNHSKTYQDIPF